MKNKKIDLKKINKSNNSTARNLTCHCNCIGKLIAAFTGGYLGNYL
jgi:hypothetical protein